MASSGFGPLRWVSFPVSWPTSGSSSPCIGQNVLPKGEEGGGKKMLRKSREYSAVSRLIDKNTSQKAFSNDWTRQLFGFLFKCNLG